jgi:hypothetical protein
MPTSVARPLNSVANTRPPGTANAATDRPEMMGTTSGMAQHAAQAPATPRLVISSFFIAVPSERIQID